MSLGFLPSRRLAVSLFAIVALSPASGFAQGATGGSLGNDNKSLSGSSSEPRAATPTRRARPEREPQRASRRGGDSSGSVARFDGVWTVVPSPGCISSQTIQLRVANGTVTGPNNLTGTVSRNGAVRTVASAFGLVVTSAGRITGNTGSGTFKQSNGCGGTVRAIKN